MVYRVVRMVSRYRTLNTALADSGIVLCCEGSIVLGVGASGVRATDCWDVPLAYDNPQGEDGGLLVMKDRSHQKSLLCRGSAGAAV